jgi:hypothetical protein
MESGLQACAPQVREVQRMRRRTPGPKNGCSNPLAAGGIIHSGLSSDAKAGAECRVPLSCNAHGKRCPVRAQSSEIQSKMAHVQTAS